MRAISKSRNFKPLSDWLKLSATTPNKLYKHMPQDVKDKLLEKLVAEQYHLCAYSGVEIEDGTSHIEHVKPRNICEEESLLNPRLREDVSYFNMIACFPKNGGDKSHGFGAPVKGGNWEEANFVSPLSSGCERRFRYSWSGKMQGIEGDTAADATIELLKLNCDSLIKRRRKAIMSFFGLGKGLTPISDLEKSKLLRIIDRPKQGKLTEFAFVLKHLLERDVKP